MAVVLDSDKGLAATGWNRDVDYRGFTVYMKPKRFLALNPPRGDEHTTALEHIRSHVAKGGALSPPFLSVMWHPEHKHWRVTGHEGRGRSAVLHELQPDTEIPVHVIPRGPDYELRARHLTDEHLFAPIMPDQRREKFVSTVTPPFRPKRVRHMEQEKQSPIVTMAEELLAEATPFVGDIERETEQNTNYRKVLYTTPRSQLVLMSLKPKESIGLEQHANDQFFRIERGRARFVINGQSSLVGPGDAVIVPANSKHNVTNVSSSEPLRVYTIYSPPKHPPGTIERTKAEAERKAKLGLDEARKVREGLHEGFAWLANQLLAGGDVAAVIDEALRLGDYEWMNASDHRGRPNPFIREPKNPGSLHDFHRFAIVHPEHGKVGEVVGRLHRRKREGGHAYEVSWIEARNLGVPGVHDLLGALRDEVKARHGVAVTHVTSNSRRYGVRGATAQRRGKDVPSMKAQRVHVRLRGSWRHEPS